jgi:uroporphyrinogen decarboxylase
MRQAGRYLPEYRKVREQARDFLALCYTPTLAAEVTLQPVRRFGLDAAIVFADILLVPHAMGQEVRYDEGAGPLLRRIETEAEVRALRRDTVAERLQPVFETVACVRGALPSQVALIGFAGAPWTVATYMLEGHGSADQRAARLWAYEKPEALEQLIDLLTEATIAYLSGQIEAGAEVVQLFDTWAGALSAEQFGRWCIAPAKRITSALKARFPAVPMIGFPRGAGASLPRYAEETGVSALSLDFTVPLDWARDVLQQKAVLQGNLDPLALVAGGPPMREAARRILASWGKGPMIFNLGHGILPDTPPEHVAELVRFVRDMRP